jgi:MYXO-CTERM domain-containing protein
MKSKLALGTMIAVALVAPAALPCGAPFGNGINVDPQQDIVVVHKNGTETYVFQPRFCGSAKEFGLILPVPAKLSAQPALSKADIFTKLVELSQPQTVYTTACSNRNWGGTTGATAGTGGGSGTVVVSSGSVGFMDYAQLEAGSVDALTSWLTANGYPYDSLATSAFDYYVQKGWYFLTFKVSQGDFTGTTTCKDLGPVKLSFPTSIPVVPTRMASARSKDNSGTLSYASSFSWRIFGITEGSQQIGFADGASSTRTLNFSGLLGSTDVSSLDGLAASGNRATKLTTTFSYGSTGADVGLGLVAGQDYREIITQVSYIQCNDGGVDSAVAPPPADAAADLARPEDVAPVAIDGSVVRKDATVVTTPDVAPPATADAADTIVIGPPPPESIEKSDAGVVPDSAVVTIADASVLGKDAAVIVTADASAAGGDAPPSQPIDQPPKKHSGGCSFTASSGADGLLPALFLMALVLGFRVRRR